MPLHLPEREKPTERADMVEYLRDHFRYHTMNSWNNSTSYARRVKIRHLEGLTAAEREKCYEALEVPDGFDDMHFVFEAFAEEHDYRYQIGQNGRSGGYLVLYSGGRKPSEHKSHCLHCGNRMFSGPGSDCGRCHNGPTVAFARPPQTVYTTGRSVGTPADEVESLDDEDLRREVDLVYDFDVACDDAIRAFVDFALSHNVVEETVDVPTKVKVARPLEESEE